MRRPVPLPLLSLRLSFSVFFLSLLSLALPRFCSPLPSHPTPSRPVSTVRPISSAVARPPPAPRPANNRPPRRPSSSADHHCFSATCHTPRAATRASTRLSHCCASSHQHVTRLLRLRLSTAIAMTDRVQQLPSHGSAANNNHNHNHNHTLRGPPQPSPPSALDSGPPAAPAAPSRLPAPAAPRILGASGSPSAASPWSSRDTSPARPPPKPLAPSSLSKPHLRTQKSSTDGSPSRGPGLPGAGPTVPSAAAIQRALSSANIPQLQSSSVQDAIRAPVPQKPVPPPAPVSASASASASASTSGDNTPHWPVSPRLKSPPPTSDARLRSRRNSLRNQARLAESSSTPAIVVQSSSPAATARAPLRDEGAHSDSDEGILSMKNVSRGPSGPSKLETVQEASLPSTPSFVAPGAHRQACRTFGARPHANCPGPVPNPKHRTTDPPPPRSPEDLAKARSGDSGSDSAANKSDVTPRPKSLLLPRGPMFCPRNHRFPRSPPSSRGPRPRRET